jgi:hypothetical protein
VARRELEGRVCLDVGGTLPKDNVIGLGEA